MCVEIVAQNGSQLKRVVVFGFPIAVTDTPNYFVGVDVDVEGGNFPPVPLALDFFFGVMPQHGCRCSFPTMDKILFFLSWWLLLFCPQPSLPGSAIRFCLQPAPSIRRACLSSWDIREGIGCVICTALLNALLQ